MFGADLGRSHCYVAYSAHSSLGNIFQGYECAPHNTTIQGGWPIRTGFDLCVVQGENNFQPGVLCTAVNKSVEINTWGGIFAAATLSPQETIDS